eukprot:TRINITY_DN6032_c0_g1_i2.p1 TRINITY_DN6032_c0_g1~~TRINITY_DN6032_c0_g1_i2.p1  ORF type:complete len:240 (-),score=40.67 TRINITY_DN6032_c0_g1_i2:52-771(-)
MPFRDRTLEFNAVTQSLLARNDIPKKPSTLKIVNNKISFNKLASEIGRAIFETSAKLNELTELSKSTSPFGDPTEKIDHLTFTIKQEIADMNHKIEQLDKFVSQNSSNKQTSAHSSTLIQTLNTNLLKTTKGFNDALQIRTQNLKTQQERIEKVTGSKRTGPSPLLFTPLVLEDEDDMHNDEITIAVPLMQTEDELIVQRTNAVKDIQVHITEIQGIFQKLSHLVNLQSEQIKRFVVII